MPGIKALRKCQITCEAVAGTIKAATTLWRGTGMIKDNRNVVLVKEDIGYLSGVNRSYVPKLGGAITFAECPATFEQLPYIFTCGIEALTTGAADTTSGTGKVYTYALATTAQKTPTTLTIEAGDNQEAEVMEYCFVDTFRLAGKAGEAVQMSADWIGRQVAVQAFTAGQAAPAVEDILTGKGALYIDAIAGTAGTTLKSSTLLGFDLTVKTGFTPVMTVDNLYFTLLKQTEPEVKLNLTFEHDATSAAEKVFWRAGTARQLQLKFTGSVISTQGTYLTKTLKLTFAGLYDSFSVIDENSGNDIVTASFIARYDLVNSKAPFTAVVANALASLT